MDTRKRWELGLGKVCHCQPNMGLQLPYHPTLHYSNSYNIGKDSAQLEMYMVVHVEYHHVSD